MHRRRHSSTAAAVAAATTFLLGCTSGSDPVAVPGADDVITAPVATLTIDDVVEQPSTDDTGEPAVTLPPLADADATTTITSTAPATTTSPTTVTPTTVAPTAVTPTTVTPTTVTPTTAAPADDGFLRIGDEGDEVSLMQLKLGALGYLPANAAPGVFDRATADGLIDFQAQYGLVVDGIFGPETDRALTAAAQSVNPEG